MAEIKGATEVVVEVMNLFGYTPAKLGKRIGVAPAAIWERLYGSRKVKERNSVDMKVSSLAAMLRGMDYKLIAVPVDKPMKSGEYELK